MRQWIEEARLGDQIAWGRIVKYFGGMAFSVAYGKLGDWGQAEDAVQEAFAEAFANLAKLKDADAFPGWFQTIIERQCHRLLRRKRHSTMPMDEASAMDVEKFNVESILEKKEWQERLHQSVEGLSSNLKLVVQLFYFHGYSIREISSYLSISPSVLKKRLFDARNKLRTSLIVTDFVSMFDDLYEGGVSMLHIVNGDFVGDKLRKGNIRGDILVWREVYPVGPVFVEMGEPIQRSTRVEYLEKTMGIPADDYVTNCKSQEQILQNFHKYDEVVLWFEHDLFDQLMLSFLLHWFSRRTLGHTKLNLLCIGDYPGIDLFRGLGQLTTKQLETLSGTWQRIGQKELETGRRIWEAYASPDIERHVELLHEDTSELPFAHAAFELHLSRLPSAMNGLGIVEQTILELIRHGVNTPRELFKEIGNRLSGLGMGDLEFWYRLRNMSERPNALLEIRGSHTFPDYRKKTTPSFENCDISLTEVGMEVAVGVKDWVKVKGMNEWYGGLRLYGDLTWRWDPERKRLVHME
ncbi:sigma-70 family RNA polymerase sigma factor [Paenibacillus sp. WQ 127069]|uniref:Sigma-70 family RNA polymerase sigma factor n=1 Tax=Paenibacillus baimaensis TaxID=2982185 RepID=A0ABT2UES3_9BACL|nr:sigma-70 family RNA polymerase sigma factor [Paenibacillus sp. WQ 127069]MCU6792144.1 sigma-70 family RNA polymerase sigma factor [Paenibacillus sp. WQ 127069]